MWSCLFCVTRRLIGGILTCTTKNRIVSLSFLLCDWEKSGHLNLKNQGCWSPLGIWEIRFALSSP